MEEREVKEFEWYLRDHLFRQSNQGRQQFKEESLADEMISLYLRYRDSNLHNMNEIKDIVVENLSSNKKDGKFVGTYRKTYKITVQ